MINVGSRLGVRLVLLVALLSACSRAPVDSIAPTPPAPSATSAGASPSPDARATVSTVEIDGLEAIRIVLGPETAPSDVVAAFGSIWVANHRDHTVSRIDPGSYTELARIPVGSGPGWFAVTDDAVWVSSQLGRGLSRIDPATNEAELRIGGWATCGAPIVAHGSIWQAACDAGQIMRIDPAARQAIDISAHEYAGAIVLVGTDLAATSPEGYMRIDPLTNELEPMEFCCGFPVGSDAISVWTSDGEVLTRRAISDGAVIGALELPGELVLTFADDRAWVTPFGEPIAEVDLGSTRIVRRIDVPSPTAAREVDGALWVTSFDAGVLWRVDLADG